MEGAKGVLRVPRDVERSVGSWAGRGQGRAAGRQQWHAGSPSRCRCLPCTPRLGAGDAAAAAVARAHPPHAALDPQRMQTPAQRTGLLVQTSVQARWGAGRGRAGGKLRSVQRARARDTMKLRGGAPGRGGDSVKPWRPSASCPQRGARGGGTPGQPLGRRRSPLRHRFGGTEALTEATWGGDELSQSPPPPSALTSDLSAPLRAGGRLPGAPLLCGQHAVPHPGSGKLGARVGRAGPGARAATGAVTHEHPPAPSSPSRERGVTSQPRVTPRATPASSTGPRCHPLPKPPCSSPPERSHSLGRAGRGTGPGCGTPAPL